MAFLSEHGLAKNGKRPETVFYLGATEPKTAVAKLDKVGSQHANTSVVRWDGAGRQHANNAVPMWD